MFLAFAISWLAFVSINCISLSSLAIDVAKIDANEYCNAKEKYDGKSTSSALNVKSATKVSDVVVSLNTLSP